MKEKEKTSPYPILSVNGRKGQSGNLQNSSPDKGRLGGVSFRHGGIFGKSKKAFTLVELIIVITILAILATIAFISFQGYTSKSRDANRASTAKNIETGLGVFQAKSGVYPIQSTGGTISVGTGNIVTVQGDLDLSIARVINLNEVPRDPKTGEMYHYISDTAGRGGKVLYYLENTPDYAFLTQSFAESEARTPIVKGEGPGVLLDTGSEMVQTNVDLFGTQSGQTYTIVVNDTTKVTGSGLELGGGFQNFAEKGGRLDAPKNCPTGFIAVPGNAEFMQPGFCVAKYEMSYENDGLAFGNTTRNTIGSGTVHPACTKSYNSINSGEACTSTGFINHNGGIVSKEGKFPIAYLTQHEAIQACKSLGGTAHLITNNEWMTIARNIEANGVNWSGGVVGVNHISNGVSNSTMGCGVGTTKSIYTDLPYDRATKTGPGGNDCDEKRKLKLSNGEVIWDLAGNIWEHVNKANTLDGRNFNVGIIKFDEISENWNGTYQWHKTGWSATTIPEKIRKKYGPSKSTYTHNSNGVGNIHGWYDTTDNNVFRRGGGPGNTASMGVFTMYLSRTSSDQSHYVGFRCAF